MAYFEGELSSSGGVEFKEPLMCPLSTRGRNCASQGEKCQNVDKGGELGRDLVEGESCTHIAFMRMHFRGNLSF